MTIACLATTRDWGFSVGGDTFGQEPRLAACGEMTARVLRREGRVPERDERVQCGEVRVQGDEQRQRKMAVGRVRACFAATNCVLVDDQARAWR